MKRIVRGSVEEFNRISQNYQNEIDNYSKQKAEYERQLDEYRNAHDSISDKIGEQIIHDLKLIDSFYGENVSVGVRRGRIDENFISIEYGGNGYRSEHALSWNYRIYINIPDEDDPKGNTPSIRKESGSWSGLNATTKENIEELQASVQMLKFIQARPDSYWLDLMSDYYNLHYRDYVTIESPIRPSKSSMAADQIEALAGTGKWVEGLEPRTYFEITKATNSMFVFEEYDVARDGTIYGGYSRRMRKEKFVDTMVHLPVRMTSREEVESISDSVKKLAENN